MNTDLKFKLLQYLNHQKKSSGFTFIELLVVIFIIGILAAIALSSFLSQAGKGKQSEARTYTGTINKGQQAYYEEKSKFSPSIDELGVGIRTASINYNYHVKVINKGTNSVAVGYSTLTPTGQGQGKSINPLVRPSLLKNYVGFVSLIPSKDNPKKVISETVVCQQKTAGVSPSLNIEWKPGIEEPRCNQAQRDVNKPE